MSAAVLTFVSDVFCGLDAAGNWAASAGAMLWLALSDDYDGYVNLNYNYAAAVQQSSTPTDRCACTVRILACLCIFVAY